MHSVSIVGCGYVGLKLAERWQNLKHMVRGFATRDESLRQIAAVGAESKLLNLDTNPPLVDLEGQLVYYTVPPAPVDCSHDADAMPVSSNSIELLGPNPISVAVIVGFGTTPLP